MRQIQDYLLQTKSAVQKLFEAHHSYFGLMRNPQRPAFLSWGDPNSEENKIKYEKWLTENKEILEERHRKDNEFAFEFFARSTLCGSILQFAYHGIKIFSNNNIIPDEFKEIIRPNSVAAKFCIGKLIDNVPEGLIVFAGRNQAMHYDEYLKKPTKVVFHKLANWYSTRFNKWYIDSYFDLNDNNVIHYAENILYKLGWSDYSYYEIDMLQMFSYEKGA